jgi:uncharacterized protein
MTEGYVPERTQAPILVSSGPYASSIPLDGVLERQKYSPLFTAIALLLLAFLLFQLVISPLVIVVGLLAQGLPPEEILEALGTIMEERITLVLAANTVGQIFGLALPALLVARMHSSKWADLLRLRPASAYALGLAFVGLMALTPLVQFLGGLNETLPLPDFLREFEQAQMDLIERVLLNGDAIWLTLLMLALTPAICEELLFRGYVQRQAERSLGIAGGILLSGIIFGLYHLRLTQVLPLATLGLYLAFLTWSTGSLYPAMLVHFANNAFAVVLSSYVSSNPEFDPADLEQFEVPWYYIVLGIAVFVPVVVRLARLSTAPKPVPDAVGAPDHYNPPF